MDDERLNQFLQMLGAASMAKAREKQGFMPIAQKIKMFYDCFIDVGFNSDQAMELTLSIVDSVGTSIAFGDNNE